MMKKQVPNWIYVTLLFVTLLFIGRTGMLFSAEEEGLCPAVCVPMYEKTIDGCSYIECGSGCGPDYTKTFDTEEQCNSAIGTCPDFFKNLPTYINMEMDCNTGILMAIFAVLILAVIMIILT